MADDSPLQNPNLLQGLAQMQQPNPYAIQGPLSMPGFYTGNSGGSGSMPPTDAMGNPIQSFQQAQQAHDAWNAANPAPASAPAMGTTLPSVPQYIQTAGGTISGGSTARNMGVSDGNVSGQMIPNPAYVQQQQQMQGQQGTAAPAAPTNPIDMRQAYLNALSKPGKVTTSGATVPESDPLGQPSVMDAFLSTNHPSSSSSNSGFFNTLNKLQSMKGTA